MEDRNEANLDLLANLQELLDVNPLQTRITLNDTDPTMLLTALERDWSLAVKGAVEGSEDLVNLTDMEYAQFAITTKGDLQEALRRIHGMQLFRQHYKIDHSVEQALYFLRGHIRLFPGLLLNIDVDIEQNIGINACDLGYLQPDLILGTRPGIVEDKAIDGNWGLFCCATYYIKFATQPSLAVIRNGLLELVDFKDYGWKNFSTAINGRIFEEVLAHIPMTWRHFLGYHTGVVGNVIVSMAKPLMNETWRKTISMGCQIVEEENSSDPPRRLKDFYLQPSTEIAYENLLERARVLLTQRKQNEARFRL